MAWKIHWPIFNPTHLLLYEFIHVHNSSSFAFYRRRCRWVRTLGSELFSLCCYWPSHILDFIRINMKRKGEKIIQFSTFSFTSVSFFLIDSVLFSMKKYFLYLRFQYGIILVELNFDARKRPKLFIPLGKWNTIHKNDSFMYQDVIIMLLGLLPNMGRHLVYILLFLRIGLLLDWERGWLAWGFGCANEIYSIWQWGLAKLRSWGRNRDSWLLTKLVSSSRV